MKNFTIDILFNPDVEWHETFTVVLGPHAPPNALFGNTTVTTVTILDNQVSGSLVLPAPPQVRKIKKTIIAKLSYVWIYSNMYSMFIAKNCYNVTL